MEKNLRKSKMEDIVLPSLNKLFINKNLCPYYKLLWFKSKRQHSLGKINSYFILGEAIKIKVSENSVSLSITLPLLTSRNIFLILISLHLSVLFKQTLVFVGLIMVLLFFVVFESITA